MNNYKLVLILGCRCFAVDYWNLKTNQYHQVLYFFPGHTLPGLYGHCLLFLLVYWVWLLIRIFHAAFVNLVFLFLRRTSDVHLGIDPLYLLWWRLLLIIDFDTDMPTSVVKGFFSSPEKEVFCHTTRLFSVSFWAVQCSWATDSKCKCHMWNKLETFHMHTCKWNEAITCTLIGNSWAVNCSINSGPLKRGCQI